MPDSTTPEDLDPHADWSRDILQRKGAVVRCADHGVEVVTSDDGLFAKAVKEGRRRRPQGLSADAAERVLREYAAGLKSHCPACA